MRITDTWDRVGGGINRTGAAIIKSRTIPTRGRENLTFYFPGPRLTDHPHAGAENAPHPPPVQRLIKRTIPTRVRKTNARDSR